MLLRDAVEYCKEHQVCAYCGEYGSEAEHVVPKHLELDTWTILACSDCNNIAGGAPLFTFRDKRDHIRAGIRKRHGKLLRMPDWTDDEIDDLGPAMRRSVLAHARAREIVLQRLSFDIETVAKLGDLLSTARRAA